MTTPFDDPQAGLAWMFLQSLCAGGDLDEGFALLGDDFSYWNIASDTVIDAAGLRRLAEYRKQVVKIDFELLGCINEGENVVVEARASGVTTSGARYNTQVAFVFETRDGLIVALREYSDARLAAQLYPPDDAG